MTRILSWNILQGGGRRADDVAAYIVEQQPDIVALQEFRAGSHGQKIQAALRKIGLGHQFIASEGGENTLFLAAKQGFDAGGFMPEPQDDGGVEPHPTPAVHIVEADIAGLTLLNLHFPQKKAQVPLFEALAADSASLLAGRTLMLGDMNCGIPFADSTGKTFENTKHFQHLLSLGWVDAWRKRHGDEQVFTWVSPRTGNGFRYDHCFASGALNREILSVEYDQSVRAAKLSDHAAMLVVLDG